ncbi:MAG: TonB-dependent receptor [Bacteroidota bacterium]
MKYTLAILTMVCFALNVYGQRANISGTILTEDNVPAVAAKVELLETSKSTLSKDDGTFLLKGIKANTYTLQVSYSGSQVLQKTITVEEGQDQNLDLKLSFVSRSIDEVVVTAKTGNREKEDAAIQVESISVEEVSFRIKDLSEAIDQLPGVRVRTSGSLGDRVDVSLNGLNGTAVRSYLDGLPLEFVYPSLNIGNVPLTNIKRIDVYKGVLPVDVGSDAMGGGINIITDFQSQNSLKASYSIGSFNTHMAGLNFNYALSEDVIINVNSSYNYSDNNYDMEAYIWEDREVGTITRFHDAYELLFVDASVIIQNKPWADFLRINANYSDYLKEVQNGGLVERLAFGEAFFEGDYKNIFVDYRKQFGNRISLSSAFAYSDGKVIFVDTTRNTYSWSGEVVNVGPAGEFGGDSFSDRDQINYVNRTSLQFKASENDVFMLSNLLAIQDVSGRDSQIPIERDPLTQPQRLSKDVAGLEYTRFLFAKKLQLSAAAKLYYFALDGVDSRSFTPVGTDATNSGWYASAKYNFTPGFFIRGSYEQAWRIPTFTQFFGNGATIVSNIGLKPESSDNYNVGIAFRPDKPNKNFNFGFEINGFLRGQNDIIFLSPNVFQQYINAEEIRNIGIEGEIFLQFFQDFSLSLNATKLEKTYESIDPANVNAQFLVGTTFPNTPNLFGNARLMHRRANLFQDNDALSTYVQYKYVDEFNFINVGQVRNDDNWVPVQHRMDAGINYTFNNDLISIGVNVYNVLDGQLFDNFKVPRPGRNFNLKLVYQLDNFNLKK